MVVDASNVDPAIVVSGMARSLAEGGLDGGPVDHMNRLCRLGWPVQSSSV